MNIKRIAKNYAAEFFFILAAFVAGVTFSNDSQADEHRVTIGLWTEHYIYDDPNYNENNELINYNYIDGNTVYSAATFKNSYFIRSYMVGVGKRYKITKDIEFTALLGAVKGYEDVLDKDYGGDLFYVPIFSLKTYFIQTTILAAAVNVGFVYEF